MWNSKPIRKAAGAALGLCVSAAGLLWLDSDWIESPGMAVHNGDFGASESASIAREIFGRDVRKNGDGEGQGRQIASMVGPSSGIFSNLVLHALNVDLVTGTKRY